LLRPAFEGPNVILVQSDTTEAEGGWYKGGGVSRHVWLERHHVLSIPEHGGKIVSMVSGTEARVDLCIELQNMSSIDRIASISIDIINPRGETAAKLHRPEQQVPAWKEGITVDFTTIIQKPTLWNIGDGQLYSAIVHVHGGEVVVHRTPACHFGLRTVEFQKDGILVNGIRHKIRGCNIRADFAGVGVGMPDRLIEYKLDGSKYSPECPPSPVARARATR
jgi:beta-galactosidase